MPIKIARFILSLVVVISICGCQQRSAESVSDQSGTEPLVVAQSEPKDEQLTEVEITGNADTGDAAEDAHAEEHGPGGRGRGRMGRGRRGGGPGMMAGMREDMTTLHTMFAAREKITRTIKNLPNGVEAVTESKDEEVASLIQEHVPAMEARVDEDKPLPPMTFHPIFVELIKHADDYTFSYDETEHGVKVTYTSEDPFVVMLIQEHAKLVSRFVKNGMEEIHKEYTLPEIDSAKESTSDAESPAPASSPSESTDET